MNDGRKSRENKNLLKDRTGEVSYTTYGSRMKIVEYNNARSIKVRFDNGYEKNCAYPDFKKGYVKSPYEKRSCGIGFIGEGNYKPTIDKSLSKVYESWINMLQRCYSEKYLKKRPAYIDCTVCEEWHNFQNFGKWYDKNFYEVGKETMCLDKDILVKGNKVYSPYTCTFVPITLNSLFVKCNKSRGDLPIGVSLTQNKEKHRVEYKNIINDIKFSKIFDTSELAFQFYKETKETHIKKVVALYKNKISQNLFTIINTYEVEATD